MPIRSCSTRGELLNPVTLRIETGTRATLPPGRDPVVGYGALQHGKPRVFKQQTTVCTVLAWENKANSMA